MKHPFWIINACLLLLILLSLGFVFISRPRIPRTKRIRPTKETKISKAVIQKVNLEAIYDNDLFGTYKEPMLDIKKPARAQQMPQPPTPKPIKVPLAASTKFLEPLNITLKGIIIVSDEEENVAIIENNKTKETKNYISGDKIEDAQLLRIMRNKVMFIRSNGQQETLYVNQYDAELDQMNTSITDFSSMIKKIAANSYQIDPIEFARYSENIAHFIDLINIKTVYAQGRSIGCQVGKIEPKSFASALGLMQTDIITHIEGIPATNTNERFKIYQKLITMNEGDDIKVSIRRKKQPVMLQYVLKSFTQTTELKPQEGIQKKPFKVQHSQQQIRKEKIKILQEKEKFAPTLHKLQMKEKRDMIRNGSKFNRKNHNVLLKSIK